MPARALKLVQETTGKYSTVGRPQCLLDLIKPKLAIDQLKVRLSTAAIQQVKKPGGYLASYLRHFPRLFEISRPHAFARNHPSVVPLADRNVCVLWYVQWESEAWSADANGSERIDVSG